MKEFGKPGLKAWLFLLSYFLFLIYSLVYEPNNLIVTRNTFDLREGDNRTIRIAFISDIHVGLQREGWLDGVVQRLNSEMPDLVLIGGDAIESDASELDKLEPLSGIKAPLGVYAVLGNHDYGGWGGCRSGNATAEKVIKKLESLGIKVLRNNHADIGGRGGFALIGLDDGWSCYDDYAAASQGVPDSMPKVILAHNMNSVHADDVRGPGVVLSGHTHCGLIRVPVLTDLALGPGFGSIIGGRERLDNDTEAHVTCGVAQGGIRAFTSPEISIINIE